MLLLALPVWGFPTVWKLFLLHDTFCSRVQVLVLKSFVFFFFCVVVIIFSLPCSKEIGLLFFFFLKFGVFC